MRVLLSFLLLATVIAGPAWSQGTDPCPATTRIPVGYQLVPPICPGVPVHIMARTCGPCVDLHGWTYMPPGPIQVHATMNLTQCIPAVCLPESLLVPIGSFAAGHHVVQIELRGTVVRPDSTTCLVVQTEWVEFDVPLACPPGPLPYTDAIRIGPPPPCATCPPPPICPNVGIPFHIAGAFPDDCFQFRGIELLPSPRMSPLPEPPIVRVFVAYNDCLGMPCRMGPVPWSGEALLPGLPARDYELSVEMAMVSWCDSTRTPDTLFTTVLPFTVVPQCSTIVSPACLLYGWPLNATDPACHATVGPGLPGRATLALNTGTVLAGLQGRLVLDPPSLQVTGLRPVGLAEHMNIAWSALADGAHFLLFSTDGHVMRSPCIPPAMCPPGLDPVLEVTVAQRPGVPIPTRTLLHAAQLLGADTLGQEVTPCPTFAIVAPAVICGARNCDFNSDGHLDIRDLVLMARCIMGRGPCPDSAATRFDCNGDGVLGVGDVLCCARVILQGRMPGDVAPRPELAVRTSVGVPVLTATGVDLPIHIAGADRVGAARLGVACPAGVFDAASVEVLGDAAGWLSVSEPGTTEAIVGLVATTPPEQTPAALDLVVHLSRAAGQSPTASVQLASVEFAGPDGTPLEVSAPVLGVPVDARRLQLSAARPNPFSRETRFTLTAAEAVQARVAIFDLAGRRVATLHEGPLPAGERTFVWNGTDGGGHRVPDGVYFYRVTGGGVASTRRLVLISGP